MVCQSKALTTIMLFSKATDITTKTITNLQMALIVQTMTTACVIPTSSNWQVVNVT